MAVSDPAVSIRHGPIFLSELALLLNFSDTEGDMGTSSEDDGEYNEGKKKNEKKWKKMYCFRGILRSAFHARSNTAVRFRKSHGGLIHMAAVTTELPLEAGSVVVVILAAASPLPGDDGEMLTELHLARYFKENAPPSENPMRNILSCGNLDFTAMSAAWISSLFKWPAKASQPRSGSPPQPRKISTPTRYCRLFAPDNIQGEANIFCIYIYSIQMLLVIDS
jgi:hypothetical protein